MRYLANFLVMGDFQIALLVAVSLALKMTQNQLTLIPVNGSYLKMRRRIGRYFPKNGLIWETDVAGYAQQVKLPS